MRAARGARRAPMGVAPRAKPALFPGRGCAAHRLERVGARQPVDMVQTWRRRSLPVGPSGMVSTTFAVSDAVAGAAAALRSSGARIVTTSADIAADYRRAARARQRAVSIRSAPACQRDARVAFAVAAE